MPASRKIAVLGSKRVPGHANPASTRIEPLIPDHPLLGPRLLTCTALIVAVQGRSLNAILGNPDDFKFHSSMTLFAEIAPDPRVFVEALARYFDDRRDPMTRVMLREEG